ncbi:MAG: ABC transporter ATP-binding protein [Deltaproteobacteria bacterium]|uniref:ABC transporter ATP-binding protein n=1 Tax=Desulfobacula sp. TaxID=2593537 RepID=UPI0019A424F2|nr:ABC transporter ATP-binding protein [Candidatus Desulfobacula maris]MBL6994224.1 ABC transporter ATP-binding protein [Desulfobacula sp.]
MDEQIILDVRELVIEFDTDLGVVRAVDHLDFQLKKGRILGLAGESGCGKSVTALSIMRLLPKPVSRMVQGQVLFNGQDISRLPVDEMHHIRGKKISMIFQEPMTALNPVHGIGKQMIEVYKLHFPKMSFYEMEKAAIQMLEKTGISDPEKVMKKYPHQLSGGMRQRVMISMSLSCEPDILIADEPTTALDVTVQAQILDLIKNLQVKSDMSVILITHDLGVIAENCDDVVVMYAGQIAEKAEVITLFKHPCHPYTRGLLTSIPSLAGESKTILPTIKGDVPSLLNMPTACRFASRCPWVEDICRKIVPLERKMGRNHTAACHLADIQKNEKKDFI